MPLDGLRAWIGEVERKLGMRTRVFLALAAIAVGGAGAAIYIAANAGDDAVSESDVQALQQQLETQIAAGGSGGSTAGAGQAKLEAELSALQQKVSQLEAAGGEGGAAKQGGSEGSAPRKEGSAPPKGAGGGGASSTAPNSAGLGKLLEEAKKQAEGE
jgi:hypothetical protein